MRGVTTRIKTQGEARVRTVTRGKVHKVLHCKTSEGNPKGCGASWNRDVSRWASAGQRPSAAPAQYSLQRHGAARGRQLLGHLGMRPPNVETETALL